jgi:hypothetical protein
VELHIVTFVLTTIPRGCVAYNNATHDDDNERIFRAIASRSGAGKHKTNPRPWFQERKRERERERERKRDRNICLIPICPT